MSNFIRDTTVDITKYLPEYMSKSVEFRAKCDAEALAHENVRKALLDILDQFFVATATWGLDMWETTFGLHSSPSDTDEQRRSKIIVAIGGTRTTTLKVLTQIVAAYGAGYVEEHNDKYYFSIYTTETDKISLEKLKEKVITYKPAHLGVLIYLGWSWNGKISFDGKYTYGTTTEKWSGS